MINQGNYGGMGLLMQSCLRRIVVGLIALALLAAAGAAVLFYLLTWRPAPLAAAGVAVLPGSAAPAGPASPPSEKATLKRLSEQMEQVREAVRERQPTAFEFRLTEAEINDVLLRQPEVMAALRGQGVEAPRLDLHPDSVDLQADVKVMGRPVRLQAVGGLELRDGRLFFTLQSLKFGLLPAPKSARNLLQEGVNAGLRKVPRRVGGRLESLAVTETEVRLAGTVGPPNAN